MKYINIKKAIAVISAGFILISMTGCKKEEKSYNNVKESYSDVGVKEENIYINTEINEKISSHVNKEVEVIEYFERLEKELDNYLNEDNLDKVKEKIINIVVSGIDFIFYDKEIKGVTFDELTNETKTVIMSIVARIDEKLENKIPGYKEIIKEKIGQGYDYASEKLDDALNYADDKLDEKYGENYQNIKDKTSEKLDDIKEEASNIYGNVSEEVKNGWSKIKNWYEEKTNKE